MTGADTAGLVVSILLLGYLLYALIFPDRL
jgi:K+-transporting ATPase KdpF subunit